HHKNDLLNQQTTEQTPDAYDLDLTRDTNDTPVVVASPDVVVSPLVGRLNRVFRRGVDRLNRVFRRGVDRRGDARLRRVVDDPDSGRYDRDGNYCSSRSTTDIASFFNIIAMNSNDISKLLRTKPHQYVVKDYVSKNATSSCWSTFGVPAEVINEQDKEFKIIEGFTSCKKCFATFVFCSGSKETGTKNLSDHKCSTKDINQPTLHEVVEKKIVASPHRDELIDSIATWCATRIRPFQCVEDPGFIIVSQMLLDIGSRYGRSLVGKVKAENLLPCANTIKRRIQSLAEITRAEVSARLVAAGGRGELAFSSDLWADRYKKQTYLGMTAIFIENSAIHNIDLCCREFLYSKKSAANVSKSIDAVLNEFNVQQYRKSAFFIIDRGSNLKAALLPNQIIYCTTHRIHSILRDTFSVSQSTTTDTT
ncbi:unnamed protein product, partial [Rotaria sordida]